MTSVNHDTAEIDPATEALTLQLIAQDLGQEVPQTLSEANPIPDHQEANSHWDDQSSDSQWDIQDPDIQCDDPNSDIEGNQTSKPLDNQSALPAEQKEVPESHSRYVSVDHHNKRARDHYSSLSLPRAHTLFTFRSFLTRKTTAAPTQEKQLLPASRITNSKIWQSAPERMKIRSLEETRPVVMSLCIQTRIIRMMIPGLQVSNLGFLLLADAFPACLLPRGLRLYWRFYYADKVLINRGHQQ